MTDDKETSKAERTRRAIVDAAHEVFLEKGFHAASMRQIAKSAGLALGGIYFHFESKEDIFSAVIIDRHPYMQILPLALSAEGDDVETFVQNTGRALVKELKNRPDFVKLVFIEIVEFGGKHMGELFQEIYPQILPLLQRFQSEKVREIPPIMLMRVFIGTFIAYYLTDISFAGTVMPGMQEDAMGHFVDIFLNGILVKE